jgi:hypothetical protein
MAAVGRMLVTYPMGKERHHTSGIFQTAVLILSRGIQSETDVRVVPIARECLWRHGVSSGKLLYMIMELSEGDPLEANITFIS